MSQDIRTIRITTQGPAGPPGSQAQVFTVASQAAMLALGAHKGDIAVRSDIGASFVLAADDPGQLGNWTELLAAGGGGEGGAVTSVAGRTGAVTLSAGDIGGLAASATTDTTNAAHIASGTLSNARLSGVALTANNLSDLANAATARGNLGLGTLAVLGVGAGLSSGGGNLAANVMSVAGRSGAVTIAAGDVSGLSASATTDTTNAGNIASGTLSNARLSGVALTANNLSDLANAATARGNLGLGALSVLGVGAGLSSGGGNLAANVTSVAGRSGAVTIAAGDVSGLAASATSDATNAANIASGTLGDARLSANVARRDQDNGFGDHVISRFCGAMSAQTASYTLAAADNGSMIFLNASAAATVTLPNSLPAGFNCVVVQEGAGQVTFSAASGATMHSPSGNAKTASQYGSVSLIVKSNSGGSAADWRLDGALSA